MHDTFIFITFQWLFSFFFLNNSAFFKIGLFLAVAIETVMQSKGLLRIENGSPISLEISDAINIYAVPF